MSNEKERAFRAEVERLKLLTASPASSGNSKAWPGSRRFLGVVLLISIVSTSLTALLLLDQRKPEQRPVAVLREVLL